MLKILTKKHFKILALTAIALTAACGTTFGTPTPTPELSDPGPGECQDRVLVIVWGDLDGDGVQDPGEPPLPDVLLQIAQKGAPPEDGLQMSTGENGRVSFPTRELADCLPAGYQVLFLRQVAGYEFPDDPVVDLADFDPLKDAVGFGLLVEE